MLQRGLGWHVRNGSREAQLARVLDYTLACSLARLASPREVNERWVFQMTFTLDRLFLQGSPF